MTVQEFFADEPNADGSINTSIEGMVYWPPNAINGQLVGKILVDYAHTFHDGYTVLDFLQMVAGGMLFTCSSGWLLMTSLMPGVSAEIHGGRFGIAGNPRGPIAETLVTTLMDVFNLQAVYAMVPAHLTGANNWAASMKFQPSGVIPLFRCWDGVPQNRNIYARYKEI